MDDDEYEDLENPAKNSVVLLVKKCKRIVEHFNRSPKLTHKLRAEFAKQNLRFVSLIQSVVTRWNSSYFMLQRIHSALDPINIVSSREKHNLVCLTHSEIEALPEVIKLLKPFADITKILNGNTKVTMSLIIPYTTSVLKELETMQVKTEMAVTLLSNLVYYTKKKLLKYETMPIPR